MGRKERRGAAAKKQGSAAVESRSKGRSHGEDKHVSCSSLAPTQDDRIEIVRSRAGRSFSREGACALFRF